jgi:group II intron reverse transcriptase/maturase
VVAINTTPAGTATREGSLAQWTKRTQEVLAHRSLQGRTFHRLYNLCCTKRLIEHALMKVLQNTGAQTAGVDGVTKHKLSSDDQQRLIDEVWQDMKAKTYRPAPVRRVYIPKGDGKQRPLGIPTIKDRVVQEMLRLILEPIYEPTFYRHSYGFRPFRSAHHAALRIKDLIGKRGYTIAIEGDIRACFDRIHHTKLLSILRRTIKDERIIRLIRDMLRAGVMENGTWQATEYGSPQGGIVSPLLANIYLSELDTFIAKKWDQLTGYERVKHHRLKTAVPCYITRYADDFVVMLRGDMAMAQQLKDEIATFLNDELHLELSAEKTLITPADQGINFLGFTIRKYREATLITPSRKAIAKFKDQVKKRAWVGFSDTDAAGIVTLNRYIIGWGQYYRRVSSTRAFRHLDHYLWWRVMRTTYRLRVRRGRRTLAQHYRRHAIPYRFDLNKKNRWRKGSHYGAWLDDQRTVALIITRLSFLPITYVRFHSQLNPYIPEERLRLEQQRAVTSLLADLERNAPTVNRDYGPEWAIIRRKKLVDAGYHCERCGTPIHGRRATVHHKTPLKKVRSRRQAHRLENLISLCPSCHALMERDGHHGKARA